MNTTGVCVCVCVCVRACARVCTWVSLALKHAQYDLCHTMSCDINRIIVFESGVGANISPTRLSICSSNKSTQVCCDPQLLCVSITPNHTVVCAVLLMCMDHMYMFLTHSHTGVL